METGTTLMSRRRNYSLFNKDKEPEVGDVVQIKTHAGGWSEPMLVISRSAGSWRDGIIELLSPEGSILAISPTSSIYNIHIMSKKS
jgi:hypothetical protein